ncbi:MAG TPA: hypothetical protein DCQ98_15105 [Planctomycetaceae bacterium]|nr:hypothetical protein [Planctomycetaceae bacterium]HRF01713.1 hypothetical protein [Pirellulaceae bacterium]
MSSNPSGIAPLRAADPSAPTSGMPLRPATPGRTAATEVDPSASAPPAGDSLPSRRLVGNSLTAATRVASSDFALPLVDAIPRSSDSERRKGVIRRYWQLSVAAMDLAHARQEAADLGALPRPSDPIQQASLAAAQSIARARVAETELAWRMTQRDLADLLETRPGGGLPFPTDAPFIGRYLTKLSAYPNAGALPTSIVRIDESLPWMLETIHARADAVMALETEFQELRRDYSGARVGLDTVLASFERLRDQRLAFLATTRDYNQLIGDFAMSVAPDGMSPEAVVGMLVKDPEQSAARDTGVRRTGWVEEQPFDAWRSIQR